MTDMFHFRVFFIFSFFVVGNVPFFNSELILWSIYLAKSRPNRTAEARLQSRGVYEQLIANIIKQTEIIAPLLQPR